MFVEAVSKINQECRDEVVILFAGKDTETINISLLSAIADLSNLRCVFLGEVSDVISIYSSLDMLVLSSITEGFPNVILQALACGVQVVATDCSGGTAEILESGKWGQLTPVRDPQTMAKNILSALKDSNPPDGQIRAAFFEPKRNAMKYLRLLLPDFYNDELPGKT